MSECGSCSPGGAGPFSLGRELVEFVYNAHGGGLKATCQGCGESFVLRTFVGKCPKCGGIHAVSPPRCNDAANIQFAGKGVTLPDV
jgi:hypothetical protein